MTEVAERSNSPCLVLRATKQNEGHLYAVDEVQAHNPKASAMPTLLRPWEYCDGRATASRSTQ